MFIIPGYLISLLTFPGVIIHEWSHKKFCEWTRVRVEKVVYYRFSFSGKPAGYVIHEEPKKYTQTFWISVGPLVINSLASIVLTIFASFFSSESIIWIFLMWVGVSAGVNAFPSNHDMKNIWETSKKEIKTSGNILHYLAFIFVAVMWIANALRFFWFDFLYAFLLVGVGSSIASYLFGL